METNRTVGGLATLHAMAWEHQSKGIGKIGFHWQRKSLKKMSGEGQPPMLPNICKYATGDFVALTCYRLRTYRS